MKRSYFQATGQATPPPELRSMPCKIQKLEYTNIEHNIQGFGDKLEDGPLLSGTVPTHRAFVHDAVILGLHTFERICQLLWS